eukprot:gene24451-10051_t
MHQKESTMTIMPSLTPNVEAIARSKMEQKEFTILCLEDTNDWSNATTRRLVDTPLSPHSGGVHEVRHTHPPVLRTMSDVCPKRACRCDATLSSISNRGSSDRKFAERELKMVMRLIQDGAN